MPDHGELFPKPPRGDWTRSDRDPHKLHRREDPSTSVEAAHRSKDLTARHEAAIVAYLEALPDRDGRTKDQIGDGIGITEQQVVRRMRKLAEDGHVQEAGTGRSHAGRSATLWRAVGHE